MVRHTKGDFTLTLIRLVGQPLASVLTELNHSFAYMFPFALSVI